MGFSKKIYRAAVAEIAKRKSNAEAMADESLAKFYHLCPRAEEINRERAAKSAAIVKVVLAGGDVRTGLTELKKQSMALKTEYDALLAKHGLSEADVLPQYTCPKCEDTGFVDGKMCICLKSLQRDIAYRELSTELPLSASTFDSFSLDYYKNPSDREAAERMISYCIKYAESFNAHSRSLLFLGATGLGKTHVSLAIANEAVSKGYGVIYGSTQSFAVSIERERFDRDVENDTVSQLTDCDLLIIDDLGTEFPSAYVNAAIYDIVNTRLLSNRPTIISTNLSLRELEKSYSERFVSRIVGNFTAFEFKGNDIRKEKRRQLG